MNPAPEAERDRVGLVLDLLEQGCAGFLAGLALGLATLIQVLERLQ